MNWRLWIGSQLNSFMNLVLGNSSIPLQRFVPIGLFWQYDAQRFAGTRQLNNIFDVGANVGQTLTGLLRYFPRSSIFCFEPVIGTFAKLNDRFGHISNVRLEQSALGAKTGLMEIHLHRDSELNTLVSDAPRQGDLAGTKEIISVNTVDGFCAENAIEYLDILKLDVQGWEIEVLKGAISMLEKRRIRFIYSEIGFHRRDTDMQYFAEFHDYMERSGFVLCGIYEWFRWGPGKAYAGFANALYINPEFNDPRQNQGV